MRPLTISCAEGLLEFLVEKSIMTNLAGETIDASVQIFVRLSFIMSERLIDATSILHCELETPLV
jgi:hypothetical protein